MTPYVPPPDGGDRPPPRAGDGPVAMHATAGATLVLDGHVLRLLDAAGASRRRWHLADVSVAAVPRTGGTVALAISPRNSREATVTVDVAPGRASVALAFAEAVGRVTRGLRRENR